MAAPVMPRPGPRLRACVSPADDLLKANMDCFFCGLDGTEDTEEEDDPEDGESAAGIERDASTPGLRIL